MTRRNPSRRAAGLLCVLLFLPWSAWAMLSTTLPREQVMALVAEEARRQDFPVDLALAVAEVESSFATLAVSHKGARGVMQIMPATGRGEFGLAPHQLFDPQINIRYGIRFLRDLEARYGDVELALSHYNGGSRVRRADGSLAVIPATRGYVDRVLERRLAYARHPLVIGDDPELRVASAAPRRSAAQAEATLSHLEAERQQVVKSLRALSARNVGRAGTGFEQRLEAAAQPVAAQPRRSVQVDGDPARAERIAQVRRWESFQ